jgi:hypothetical protein
VGGIFLDELVLSFGISAEAVAGMMVSNSTDKFEISTSFELEKVENLRFAPRTTLVTLEG